MIGVTQVLDITGQYIETSDGVLLAVYESGNPKGESIVFLSGFGFSHTAFTLQNRSFLAEKYRLISVDLRGHGDSSKPIDPDAYTTSQAWARDLEAVFTQCKCSDTVVVGWSFGAMVFMDWLRCNEPSSARGFVSVGSNAGLLALDDAARERRTAALKMFNDKQLNFDEETLAARAFARSITKGPLNDDLTTTMVTSNLKQPRYAARLVAQKSLEHHDAKSALKCPTLFVLGEHDGGNNAEVLRKLAQSLPDARTEVMSDVGHAPFLEDPHTFNTILDRFMLDLLPQGDVS